MREASSACLALPAPQKPSRDCCGIAKRSLLAQKPLCTQGISTVLWSATFGGTLTQNFGLHYAKHVLGRDHTISAWLLEGVQDAADTGQGFLRLLRTLNRGVARPLQKLQHGSRAASVVWRCQQVRPVLDNTCQQTLQRPFSLLQILQASLGC